MSVQDFLDTYQNSLLNKKTTNPLSNGTSSSKPVSILPVASTASFGSSVPSILKNKTSNAVNTYMSAKADRTSDLASRYSQMAAGQIPTNEFGVVQRPAPNYDDAFNAQLKSTDQIGKNAVATQEAGAQWQQQQQLKQLNAGYQVNWTPGASSDNAGAKAVAMAMTAYQNHVPYVWGGNSLSGGVDCSGLVQQIYKKLGVNLPRTTYEQAKAGTEVSLNKLLPGDLVFYNTGSSDPNGIGSLSHVAIYIGNGQVISALNTKSGIKIQPVNNNGGAARAVRPW